MWSAYSWILLVAVCNADTGACEKTALQGFQSQQQCRDVVPEVGRLLGFVSDPARKFRTDVTCVAVELREA